ncbi:hypothetical protein [Halorussus sp. AFM4]|uniref:hypothetical protein n=1 Tax=Halorussus sp. AFM4 TaxID=3421651 RepID=UPI003EB7F47E
MSKTSALLDLVCAQRRQMRVIIGVLAAMGFLLALSIPFVGPGDRVYPILIIDIVLVVGLFALFSGAYWYCTKRAMDDD